LEQAKKPLMSAANEGFFFLAGPWKSALTELKVLTEV
jgi:hypothetical protein